MLRDLASSIALPLARTLFSDSTILPPVHFSGNCKLGKKISISSFVEMRNSTIKDSVSIGPFSVIWDTIIGEATSLNQQCHTAYAVIGKFSRISWNVTIGATNHSTQNISSYFVEPADTVHVGSDVWLGANSVIFPGVKVGNGSIIGAGALVREDVSDYAVVAGVPAKILRYRFDAETVEKLKQIKWWQISANTFFENPKVFNSNPTPENLKTLEELVKKSVL
jgi:hypothetical protein